MKFRERLVQMKFPQVRLPQTMFRGQLARMKIPEVRLGQLILLLQFLVQMMMTLKHQAQKMPLTIPVVQESYFLM